MRSLARLWELEEQLLEPRKEQLCFGLLLLELEEQLLDPREEQLWSPSCAGFSSSVAGGTTSGSSTGSGASFVQFECRGILGRSNFSLLLELEEQLLDPQLGQEHLGKHPSWPKVQMSWYDQGRHIKENNQQLQVHNCII